MKRVATAVILLAALVLGTVAVAGVSPEAVSTAPAAKSGKAATTTLTVWVGWSARELNEFKKVVAEYDRKNAAVQVKVVGGIIDDKILAALRSGNAPDVVSSFTSANVGIYCPSGGWIDLGAVPEARQHPHQHLPGGDDVLHAVQGQAVRAAAPRRRVRLLLQQGDVQGRRPDPPAADARRADHVREEADEEEGGRLTRRGRLQPVLRLLPEHDQRLSAADQREVVRRQRQVQPQQGRRPGRTCSAGRRA